MTSAFTKTLHCMRWPLAICFLCCVTIGISGCKDGKRNARFEDGGHNLLQSKLLSTDKVL
jgi:hypothetical protein